MLQKLKDFETKRSEFVDEASQTVQMIAVTLMMFGGVAIFLALSLGGTAVITYFEGTLHDPSVLLMFAMILLAGFGLIGLGYVVIGVERLEQARNAAYAARISHDFEASLPARVRHKRRMRTLFVPSSLIEF